MLIVRRCAYVTRLIFRRFVEVLGSRSEKCVVIDVFEQPDRFQGKMVFYIGGGGGGGAGAVIASKY